jgi:hypothetical protein
LTLREAPLYLRHVRHPGGELSQQLIIAVLLFAGAAIAALAVFARRLLLPLYLKEIRRVEIPRDPEDTIITYQLA